VSDPARATHDPWLRGWPWLHLALCAAALLALYHGALSAPFFSDDHALILENPVTEGLSPAHLRAMFEPHGTQVVLTGTYAPLHMLAMALERAAFGLEQPLAWHVANVLLHALATVLVASLLLASGLSAAAALCGAALFGLHPALIEGVAWISQSKTVLCGVFAFGALRAWRERPALATALFAAALLSKPHAAFALPTAAAFAWVWRDPARARWLALWCALFALYALPELIAFREYSGYQAQQDFDPGQRLRSIGAIAARYAWMAATSLNVAAFAQPDPPGSWLDPSWLAGAALLVALGLRALRSLRARREEGAYWILAASAFAPVSQIFPFLFPIADRYLYFALPGLIGAALLWSAELARQVAAARGERFARSVRRAGALAGIALAALFALRSEARARLWREPTLLFLDSARHYPDGYPAQLMRARRAAQQGNAAEAAQALRAAHARGASDFMAVAMDPALAPISASPEFAAVLREMAQRFVETTPVGDDTDQATWHLLAHAELLRGDPQAAARALTSAIRAGGLQEAVLRQELAALMAADPSLSDAERAPPPAP
jgi:hypothetical protein